MPSRTPNLRFIANEDGAVILDVDHNTICTLNTMGAYVWQDLQSGKQLDEVIANLRRDTGEDSLLIERDVHAFFEDLEQRHLLPR
jgi:Coenzyme PQQ synthesis protein D (PqqD)